MRCCHSFFKKCIFLSHTYDTFCADQLQIFNKTHTPQNLPVISQLKAKQHMNSEFPRTPVSVSHSPLLSMILVAVLSFFLI